MGTGKKKIEIKRKEKESDRLVAFSKRRKGLFKKAHELHTLSGAHIAVLVFSPADKIFIYGDPCFNHTVDKFLYYDSVQSLTRDNHMHEEDFREIEACKSWLDTLNVDTCDDVNDLVSVKNDLEQIRDSLIQRIGGVGDCN